MKRVLLSIIILAGSSAFASDPVLVVKDSVPSNYSPLLNTNVNQMTSVLEAKTRQGGIQPMALLENSAAIHDAQVLSTHTQEVLPAQSPSSAIVSSAVRARPVPHPIQSPSQQTTYITTCQDITAPGNYVVSANLLGDSSCLSIHNTSNVHLECDNHTISASYSASGAMDIDNVNGLFVEGCNIQSVSGPTPAYPMVRINNSQNVEFVNNTVEGFDVNSLNGGIFASNHITDDYNQSNSSRVTVMGNTIQASPTGLTARVLGSEEGSSNIFENNTLDGGWNGDPANYYKNGADDIIYLENESGDSITGNIIQNTWDTGIESLGSLTNTVIASNIIRGCNISAIGSYWNTSWTGNTIQNNQTSNVGSFFIAEFTVWPYSTPPPPPSTIYFSNNQFINNTLTSPHAAVDGPSTYEFSVLINFANLLLPASDGNSRQLVAQNNMFAKNNFSAQTIAPYIVPTGSYEDGGGNICGAGFGGTTTLNCGS